MRFTTTTAAALSYDRNSDSAATRRWINRAAHKAERAGARVAIAEGLAELD